MAAVFRALLHNWHVKVACSIVIRNGKIVWKIGRTVDIFTWTWNVCSGAGEAAEKWWLLL